MKIEIEKNMLAGNLSLPIDGLSKDVQAIIQGYTDGYQCNRDFITASIFSAVATAVGKKVRITDERYENHLTFFTCLVAPSGSNKSTPMKAILKPLYNRNAQNYEIYQDEIKKYNAEIKAGNENADRPLFRQLILNDSTPESRIKALSENPNVLLVSDELSTMFYNMNRYNKSGEVPQLLSIWDSDDIVINRKSENTLLIKEPCLSIIGGIQPSLMGDIFGSNLFMNSGFNPRWLFVYPDTFSPAMYSDNNVSKALSDEWNRYIETLLDSDLSSTPSKLFIIGDAKQVYISYYNELQLKKSESCDYMAAVYAKLQIMVQRLAGVIHLLGNNPGMSRILPEEMEYAIRCMNYFERCAEKVYADLTEGKTKPDVGQMGKEEMIANVYHLTKPESQSSYAKVLGCSKQFISKCLKKYPRFTGCRLTDIETADSEIDDGELPSTTNEVGK